MREFSAEDLRELVRKSAEHNLEINVNGFIIYENQQFLQVLEGDRLSVSEIYHKISNDDRHEILQDAELLPTQERVFKKWSMEHISQIKLSTLHPQQNAYVRNCWRMMFPNQKTL